MNTVKKILKLIFIDGMTGMATGLFATLIVGTILVQIGSLIPGTIGSSIVVIGKVASALTGAGIGVGVAHRLKESPLTILSAAAAGMVGAFAAKILEGSVFADGVIHFSGPGEPLGAFLAALTAAGIGHLVSGKTKIDILVTPVCGILSGSLIGLLAGPPISAFMNWLGAMIEWGTLQAPFVMGIIVSVLMGMILTLPISSAALGVILGLSGISAGAATVGCCANMVGFAVASYRENKFGGLLAQGVGTSMLQVPNIVRKPVIWLPVILTSAILGPLATSDFVHMTNNATGSGMGTAGLVGQFTTYATMTGEGADPILVLVKIALMHFILPAALTLIFSELMRKKGWISYGDMKLEI